MKNLLTVAAVMVTAAVGGPLPVEAVHMLQIATVFIGLDTVAGVWLAFVERRVSSRLALVGMVSKLIQFTILLTMALAVSMLTRQWAVLCVALMGIIGIEALSLAESMTRLEKWGVNLGPIAPLVRRLCRYFNSATAEESKTLNALLGEEKKSNAETNDSPESSAGATNGRNTPPPPEH